MEEEAKKSQEGEIDLSIIIPSYNEKKRFPRTLEAYMSFFDKLPIKYEIIFADYSNDGSKDLIREYQKKHSNIVLLNINSKGKGIAVLEAFRICRGKFLSFTDADNATPPEEFYKMYNSFEGYDAVIGSRGLSRSHVKSWHKSPQRRIGSFVLGVFFVKIIYGLDIKDTQCGAKIFRREKLIQVLPMMRIKDGIFDIELLWRFKRIGRINEVPISWTDDKFSNFKWRDTIYHAIWLLWVRFDLQKLYALEELKTLDTIPIAVPEPARIQEFKTLKTRS